MPCRSLCVHLLLALLLLPAMGSGQQDTETRWEAAVGGGFLIPHRSLIRHHIAGHAWSMQWTWSRKGLGLWGCARESPRWGGALRINSSGAPDAVGHQVHLIGFASLRMSERWRFRMGGGIGWTERHWDADSRDGRSQVIIGSPLNSAIEIGLHRPARWPAKSWSDPIGVHLCLSHQSNASVTQPNLGTNVVTLALSTSWPRPHHTRVQSADTLAVVSVLPPPVQGWALYAGFGRRQPAPLADREGVAEFGGDWCRGGLRSGILIGAMVFQRAGTMAAGLHAGFQIRFTRVHIGLLHGRYLQRLQPEECGYNRVVLQWHGQGALWWRVGLHTHGFRAHHPTFGLAWSLSGRTPYGALRAH